MSILENTNPDPSFAGTTYIPVLRERERERERERDEKSEGTGPTNDTWPCKLRYGMYLTEYRVTILLDWSDVRKRENKLTLERQPRRSDAITMMSEFARNGF